MRLICTRRAREQVIRTENRKLTYYGEVFFGVAEPFTMSNPNGPEDVYPLWLGATPGGQGAVGLGVDKEPQVP
jgi:hypothetical protein